LKLGFLFVLLGGDFNSVFTQEVPDDFLPEVPEEEDLGPAPYRPGNCIIDDYLMYRKVLENPT
jgi:hypothetical protein